MSIRLIALLLLFSSCSHFTKKGDWGKRAWWPVKWENVKNAFVKNATSAHVWGPVGAAGVIHVMAWDNKMSKWINDEKLVFDDQTGAENYSDTFNDILKYEMYLSIFLTPSNNEDNEFGNYALNKLRGGLLVNVSASASSAAHRALRKQTKRTRPDGSDDNSMPSGHATQSGARRVLITRNLESTDYKDSTKLIINSINTTMSAGVMWARVEGQDHYPTDVLMGYALGSFLSGFIYDALINLDPEQSFSLAPTSGGGHAQYTLRF